MGEISQGAMLFARLGLLWLDSKRSVFSIGLLRVALLVRYLLDRALAFLYERDAKSRVRRLEKFRMMIDYYQLRYTSKILQHSDQLSSSILVEMDSRLIQDKEV